MSKKKVVLFSEELGPQEFELGHAKRLVSLEHRQGKHHWVLEKDSKYEIANGTLTLRDNPAPIKVT